MLELRLNLPEVAEFVKMIPNSKEKLLELMRYDLKQNATAFVNSVLSCELDLFLGRGKYESKKQQVAIFAMGTTCVALE